MGLVMEIVIVTHGRNSDGVVVRDALLANLKRS